MELITFNFITPSGYKKKNSLPRENKTKKMITTSMLRRQVWMADDDEFDHIIENSPRVFGLSTQYENH